MNAPKKPRRMARPLPLIDADGTPNGTEATASIQGAPIEKRTSKLGLVLALLRAEGGTTLTAIVDATGWLPHTARAALTCLRRKGHTIVRNKVDSVTFYSITSVASE